MRERETAWESMSTDSLLQFFLLVLSFCIGWQSPCQIENFSLCSTFFLLRCRNVYLCYFTFSSDSNVSIWSSGERTTISITRIWPEGKPFVGNFGRVTRLYRHLCSTEVVARTFSRSIKKSEGKSALVHTGSKMTFLALSVLLLVGPTEDETKVRFHRRSSFFFSIKKNKTKKRKSVNTRNRQAHVRLVPMYRSNKRNNGKPPLVTRHTETDEMIN